ncbi:M12 family metallo-peptidase [Hymenobacter sp. ASUV-10]|uniref:M12 family metallo-peptidase n=1 Tax=Hymenobacter aranciens TaxID=3063996 RepID=A0ABT9B837_9BACT|nr:zinc-dependent metalloprotease family protein [Hymenobacter sp. ASUV-10]MDO7874368.1 M12 family metallo-peptidase [Hymenobacter sp. ASUV-10]
MSIFYVSAIGRFCSGLSLILLLVLSAVAQPTTLLLDDPTEAVGRPPALAQARPLRLDLAAARVVLATAPPEDQPGAAPLVLALPLPDGRTARVAVWETSVMAPALAARYPLIHTYTGYGLDDATATVRLDVTPAGFHAQLLSATTGTVYIDPARRGDTQHYRSFFRRDMRTAPIERMTCAVEPATEAPPTSRRPAASATAPLARRSGSLLRTYRLALAATGEYAAFHGGTRLLALAALVTTLNRVVGVYEKELAVRLVLVPNNDQLIYLDPTTDPYTNQRSGIMLNENQANVDAVIGTANYDIGHVFGLNIGGIADYASVCTPRKARGMTGPPAPVGDAFDIDYVCHEMGHQFGASHSFNGTTGSCTNNRSADHAWEPGSGSTIMGYAGICAPQDVQPHSDAYFHAGSYEEMRPFIEATACAMLTPTANTPPVVELPANDVVLPARTSFRLTAHGADAEADTLTYCWEQIDRGSAGGLTTAQVAGDNVPLFRSFPPQRPATRYFPQLADLVSNTASVGERLPTVARQLTFRCTVRDQHRGPAGIIGGVSTSDSLRLRVTSAAGPFRLTAPNTALTWAGGSTQTVTWDVAGTTANGVDCPTVNIRLSTDGGYTYPTLLLAGAPNSGTAAVTLPAVQTTQARMMVEAATSYFFDISDQNFTISTPQVCPPPTALAVSNITGTAALLNFMPAAGATQYLVTTVPATLAQVVSTSPVPLMQLVPGTSYTVSISTDCGADRSVAATADFTTPAPPLCAPPSELTVRNVTTTTATVEFVGTLAAGSYTVRTLPASSTQTVTGSPTPLSGLLPGTRYQVLVESTCAGGQASVPTTAVFQTRYLPPVNDRCSDALPLTCGVPVPGTTNGATATDDPTIFCRATIDQGGVFYTLTGNGSPIALSTCDPATDFDTKLFVFRGACGGPYTCVVGNNDAAGCAPASALTFNSVAGQEYLVFVSGFANLTGNFRLLATCQPTATTGPAAVPALEVWPNPAEHGRSLHLALSTTASSATATLRNVLGQVVAHTNFGGRQAELPIPQVAVGTYLLTVQVAGQLPVTRWVAVE